MTPNPCDELSKFILRLLESFSKQIMAIDDSILELLKDSQFNSNPDFMEFIAHFNKGRYYHFQCEGYMKCLVLTKCYSPMSISYWLNTLVYPAVKHFTEALACLDKVEAVPVLESNPEFKNMLEKVDVFKEISMKITESVKMYNL